MFTIRNVTGRIKGHQADHMGRWVTQTLRGHLGNQITIISVYQPVTDSPNTRLMTVTAQQRNMLEKMRDPVMDPRKAFKRDLRILLQQLMDQKDDTLLAVDFNETIDEDFNGCVKNSGFPISRPHEGTIKQSISSHLLKR